MRSGFSMRATAAITEMDGVRVIGQETSDFIQKFLVGDLAISYPILNIISPVASTLSVFKPGSTSPSAILFDAWQNFVDKSPKADESIRSIRPDLVKAVDECIDAAGQEWEPYWQCRLLNVRILFPFISFQGSCT